MPIHNGLTVSTNSFVASQDPKCSGWMAARYVGIAFLVLLSWIALVRYMASLYHYTPPVRECVYTHSAQPRAYNTQVVQRLNSSGAVSDSLLGGHKTLFLTKSL